MGRPASWLALLLPVSATAALSCGHDESQTTSGGCNPTACPPALACPDGFAAMPDTTGCAPLLPMEDCPAGTRPVIGSSTCQPVGWGPCPEGFAPDPSGWGCRAILPPAACTGATREALGDTSCEPIGDCNAAFPPSDATSFVDATFTTAELDATHHLTIGEAIADAAPGTVIAVAAGTYAESLVIPKQVTIAGRCAERVILDADGSMSPAIESDGAIQVTIRGITIRGHAIGIRVKQGSLFLEDAVVTDNSWAAVGAAGEGSGITIQRSALRNTSTPANGLAPLGVLASAKTQVTIANSVVAANQFANVTIDGVGARATITKTVLRDGVPPTTGPYLGQGGFGVYVIEGGDAEVLDSAIIGNRRAGVSVAAGDSGVPSSAHVARADIRDTLPDNQGYARGIETFEGSQMTIDHATIATNREQGMAVASAGSVLHAENVVVLGPIAPNDDPAGVGFGVTDGARGEIVASALVSNRMAGVFAQRDGVLTIDGSLIRDTRPTLMPSALSDQWYGLGAITISGGNVTLTSSALLHNQGMGIFGRDKGTAATLSSVIVDGVAPDKSGLYGRGINVQDGASLDMTASAILHTEDAGVVAFASPITIADSAVLATMRGNAPDSLGIGVMGALSASLSLTRTTLARNADLGLVFSGSSGLVMQSFISSNAIGIQVQDGSSLLQQKEASSDPLAVVVTPDTRFIANATRIGSGTLPLPQPAQ